MGRDEFAARAAYQPEPTAVGAARRFVRDTLHEWITAAAADDGHGLVDDAVLLTSELVTNAVVHAGTPVRVDCRLSNGEVEVVVSDGDPAALAPDSRREEYDPAERTSGRGLMLPAALASAWGVTYGRAAKAVWFRLGLPGWGGGRSAEEAPAASAAPAPDLGGGGAPESAALASALRGVLSARGGEAGAAPASAPGSGYGDLLAATVESARSAVGADVACAMMADEDGELRLRAVAGGLDGSADGSWPRCASGPAADGAGAPPSVLTAAFVVDGRVSGLLSAASGTPGRFGDDDWARLQRLADRWGAPIERARLSDLERLRRRRLGALADARALLRGRLGREEALALAARAAVPRLAAWCAVLLPEDGVLRPVQALHAAAECTQALRLLLERLCAVAGPVLDERSAQPPPSAAGAGRPVQRWPLTLGEGERLPDPAEALTGDDAWCFPLAAADVGGYFLIGQRRCDRLPREVAELAADLAGRLGVALRAGASVMS